MAADMFSDYLVTASLYYSGDRKLFSFAVLLCLLPYVVLATVLFRPAYRTQARAHKKSLQQGQTPSKMPTLNQLLPVLPLVAFAPLWCVISVPVVAVADVFLLTTFLCADIEKTAQLVYYESLRKLVEVSAIIFFKNKNGFSVSQKNFMYLSHNICVYVLTNSLEPSSR